MKKIFKIIIVVWLVLITFLIVMLNALVEDLNKLDNIKIDLLDLKIDLLKLEMDTNNYENKRLDFNLLKNANVFILNSLGYQGSGVVIKYGSNLYILTVAHLLEDNPNLNQILTLFNNNHDDGVLKIIKRDVNLDLMLCEIPEKFKPLYYVELAEKEPENYSDIVIVGNPLGLEDFISKGIIYTYYQTDFIYIDHSYFGNSGGGIYNTDNELIGITTKIASVNYNNIPFTIHIAVRLDAIKQFLQGIENIENVE